MLLYESQPLTLILVYTWPLRSWGDLKSDPISYIKIASMHVTTHTGTPKNPWKISLCLFVLLCNNAYSARTIIYHRIKCHIWCAVQKSVWFLTEYIKRAKVIPLYLWHLQNRHSMTSSWVYIYTCCFISCRFPFFLQTQILLHQYSYNLTAILKN